MQQEARFHHVRDFLTRSRMEEKGEDLRWAFALTASVNAAKARQQATQLDTLPY